MNGTRRDIDIDQDTHRLQRCWQEQRFRLGMRLRELGRASPKVIEAIVDGVPREQFVSRHFLAQAYENLAMPTGDGQTISAPEVVCQMTSALALEPHHHVLEIGTGSGYQCAVLARLSKTVVSIERFERLAKIAKQRLAEVDALNVTQFVGDGTMGAPALAPFDRILLTAACENVPRSLIEQLAVGGIMVAPIGKSGKDQHLVRLQKVAKTAATSDYEIRSEVLGRVRFVPLVASMPQA